MIRNLVKFRNLTKEERKELWATICKDAEESAQKFPSRWRINWQKRLQIAAGTK